VSTALDAPSLQQVHWAHQPQLPGRASQAAGRTHHCCHGRHGCVLHHYTAQTTTNPHVSIAEQCHSMLTPMYGSASLTRSHASSRPGHVCMSCHGSMHLIWCPPLEPAAQHTGLPAALASSTGVCLKQLATYIKPDILLHDITAPTKLTIQPTLRNQASSLQLVTTSSSPCCLMATVSHRWSARCMATCASG
jgi:hypothetical protein